MGKNNTLVNNHEMFNRVNYLYQVSSCQKVFFRPTVVGDNKECQVPA